MPSDSSRVSTNKAPMRRIGLTGGVGCGKSAVLEYMEKAYAAVVLRSDELARELMEPGGACHAAVCALFEEEIRTEDGTLDRAKMAERMYADDGLRQAVNAIVHPAVWEEIHRREEEAEANGTRVFCVESALLLTQKDTASFDEVWYVYADESVRRARLQESRGYSEEKTTSIMASQNSDAEFRAACDVVIDNSGTKEETRRQIDRLLGE